MKRKCPSKGLLHRVPLFAVTLGSLSPAFAAEIAYKVSGSSTAEATTATNWVGDVAPGVNDIATWLTDIDAVTAGNQESRGGTITIASDVSWAGIKHQDSTGALNLTGAQITLGASGLNIGPWENLTIANNIVVGADQTWAIGIATSISGSISGSAAVTKTGGSNLTLSGAISTTGQLNLTGGDIIVTGNSLGTGLTNLTGGRLIMDPTTAGSTVTLGSLRTSKDVRVGNNALVDITSGSLGMNTTSGFWIQPSGTGTAGRLTSSSGTLTINSVDNAGVTTTGNLTTIDHQIRIVIADSGSTPLAVVKGGSNSLVLNQANTYTGGTTINGGRIGADNTAAFGTGAVIVNSGGQAYLTVGGTYANNFTLSGIGVTEGSGNLGALRLSNNTVLSGTVSLAANARITTNTAGETATLSNTISGGAGAALEKTGLGTVILTGTNTYAGVTNVTEGTLRVNGANNGAGAVNVGATGRLEGTGSIAGAVNVTGVIAPGASIESLRTSALSFANGSTLAYEFNSTTPNADLLTVNGTLDLVGTVNLTLTDLAAGVLTQGTKFTLINYTGGWTASELFTYSGNTLADNSIITIGSNQWRFDYNDITGGSNFASDQTAGSNYVTMTVVPEPTVALLGGLGLLGLLRRRRN